MHCFASDFHLTANSILRLVFPRGPTEPTAGNGFDFGRYSFTQTLSEVSVQVPVPAGTRSRDLLVEIKRKRLSVGLKGEPAALQGELWQAVKPDDCLWSIGEYLRQHKEGSMLPSLALCTGSQSSLYCHLCAYVVVCPLFLVLNP